MNLYSIVSCITSDYCKIKIFKLISYTVFQYCQFESRIWISVYLAGLFGFDGYRASGNFKSSIYNYKFYICKVFADILEIRCLQFHIVASCISSFYNRISVETKIFFRVQRIADIRYIVSCYGLFVSVINTCATVFCDRNYNLGVNWFHFQFSKFFLDFVVS